MRRRVLPLFAALLALSSPLGAQAPEGVLPPLPSVTLPPALDRVLRAYEEAWAAGDAIGLAALFTKDGFVASRGGWILGREPIREEYAGAGGPLRLRALSWATDGEVGWIVGAYGYGPMAEEFDSGKFLLALRRGDDGVWRIAADLDQSNMGAGGGSGSGGLPHQPGQ
jgi:hypothetical protein